MTANVDIVNRALQSFGARTTVTQTQLDNGSNNAAKQANLIYTKVRDQLLRMAPWNCATAALNLAYISSISGTPENTSPASELWAPGMPIPPWAYEYQYPVDCLRPLWVVPAVVTGFSGGIPITTAVTGGAPIAAGPPVKFKVAIDRFIPVTGAVISAGGSGHAIGDIITLASGASDEAPIGAPAKLLVVTLAGSAIATVSVVNQILGEATPKGGSYFERQTNPVAQGSTTGVGIDATFTLTYGTKDDQRVILTNQESASMIYLRQVTNPNVMDELFLEAWVQLLGARLAIALSGDKKLASLCIMNCNRQIELARATDGNEGLTINDVTPDWIRVRGYEAAGMGASGPWQVDWGPLWPVFV